MTLRTKAEIATIADVRHQSVSAALRAGRLVENTNGLIDLDAPETKAYLQREGSQRRSGKRRRARDMERSACAQHAPPEEYYGRSIVEECIKEAWGKCLDYVSELTLPVVLGQIADSILKARTKKKAIEALEKFVKQEIDDIEGYVEHAIIHIIDGPEAAAEWDEQWFDDEGNLRTETREEKRA